MKALCVNRKAKFNYNVIEKYTAGIILAGHEVKGIKNGCSITESYAKIIDNQIFLCNCKIDKYKHASNVRSYDDRRERLLLLKKSEIKRFIGKMSKNRLSIIPLQVFINPRGYVKIELGLCTSQSNIDKRDKIKKRDIDISMQREINSY